MCFGGSRCGQGQLEAPAEGALPRNQAKGGAGCVGDEAAMAGASMIKPACMQTMANEQMIARMMREKQQAGRRPAHAARRAIKGGVLLSVCTARAGRRLWAQGCMLLLCTRYRMPWVAMGGRGAISVAAGERVRGEECQGVVDRTHAHTQMHTCCDTAKSWAKFLPIRCCISHPVCSRSVGVEPPGQKE